MFTAEIDRAKLTSKLSKEKRDFIERNMKQQIRMHISEAKQTGELSGKQIFELLVHFHAQSTDLQFANDTATLLQQAVKFFWEEIGNPTISIGLLAFYLSDPKHVLDQLTTLGILKFWCDNHIYVYVRNQGFDGLDISILLDACALNLTEKVQEIGLRAIKLNNKTEALSQLLHSCQSINTLLFSQKLVAVPAHNYLPIYLKIISSLYFNFDAVGTEDDVDYKRQIRETAQVIRLLNQLIQHANALTEMQVLLNPLLVKLEALQKRNIAALGAWLPMYIAWIPEADPNNLGQYRKKEQYHINSSLLVNNFLQIDELLLHVSDIRAKRYLIIFLNAVQQAEVLAPESLKKLHLTINQSLRLVRLLIQWKLNILDQAENKPTASATSNIQLSTDVKAMIQNLDAHIERLRTEKNKPLDDSAESLFIKPGNQPKDQRQLKITIPQETLMVGKDKPSPGGPVTKIRIRFQELFAGSLADESTVKQDNDSRETASKRDEYASPSPSTLPIPFFAPLVQFSQACPDSTVTANHNEAECALTKKRQSSQIF